MIMSAVPSPDDLPGVAAFIRRCGAGVVATVDEHGHPEAAFVGLAALDDGTLVLDAPDDARKVRNIGEGADVAVVVTEGDVSLQLEGRARCATGEERAARGADYERQFPGSRALVPGFVVIVIDVRWVRVYDASQTPAVVAEALLDATR